MTAPIVVAHVFGAMDPGGAELRTVELLEMMDSNRFRFVFFALSGREGELAARIRRAGAEIVALRISRSGARMLRHELRVRNVDVLHSHVATFSGVVLLASIGTPVRRRIAHFRSDSDRGGSGPVRRLQRAVGRRLVRSLADYVVGVSPSSLAFAAGRSAFPPDQGLVLPSGLALEAIRRAIESEPLPLRQHPGERVMIHVGRAAVAKNRPRALEVVAAVNRRGVDCRLLFAGAVGDAERARLISLAQAMGIEERVEILGHRSDLAHLLRSVDALLVTSTREGLPGIVLEACALGTPTVSSKLPGVDWIAQHLDGITTLPLSIGDERWSDELVRASSRFISDEERLQSVEAFENSHFASRTAAIRFEQLWSAGLDQ